MPTGWSAVSRSASAGKSRTRRSGPGATVVGSNTTTSAHAPGAQVAAVGEAEEVGLQAGELADGVLERHHASRSRTQLPRKSVACGASHSWPTWAPASDRPSVQCSSTQQRGDLVGVVVGEDRR